MSRRPVSRLFSQAAHAIVDGAVIGAVAFLFIRIIAGVQQ